MEEMEKDEFKRLLLNLTRKIDIIHDKTIEMSESINCIKCRLDSLQEGVNSTSEKLVKIDTIETSCIQMSSHIYFVENIMNNLDNIRPTNLISAFLSNTGLLRL